MILKKISKHTMRKFGRFDYLIELTWTPTWLGRLFGVKECTSQLVGNCTVWHHYPGGQRAGTEMEGNLCDVWQQWKWKLRERDDDA